MVKIDVVYQGDYATQAVHAPSGAALQTDPPLDNRGKGTSFSPTDLLATSVGTCMISLMAMKAKDLDVPFDDVKLTVEKHMSSVPRRHVGKLVVTIKINHQYDEATRMQIEEAALTSPVRLSINPEIDLVTTFIYS